MRRWTFSLLVAASGIAGCGDVTGAGSRLTITPAATMLAVGDTLRLGVSRSVGAAGRWQVSDSAAASIDASGVLRALDTGRVDVRLVVGDDTARSVVEIAPAVLVGAGDIATCANDWDERTAQLLAVTGGVVFTAGDNAYQDGTAAEFSSCYHPSWGREVARTRPSPGNHDYHTPDAAGYFAYFGDRAGPPGVGYYAYDLGPWRVYSLNSNREVHPGSPQDAWLRADLGANPRRCILAYWHHPVFSSGREGSDPRMRYLLDVLYASGVDVIIAGHDHHYERFAPQDPAGVADPVTGVRQFVVGTGGAHLFALGATAVPNSQARDDRSHGVLRLALYADRYRWQFVRTGAEVADSGATACSP